MSYFFLLLFLCIHTARSHPLTQPFITEKQDPSYHTTPARSETWSMRRLLKHLGEKEKEDVIIGPKIDGLIDLYLHHTPLHHLMDVMAQMHWIDIHHEGHVWVLKKAKAHLITFQPKHRPLSDFQTWCHAQNQHVHTPYYVHADATLNTIMMYLPPEEAHDALNVLSHIDQPNVRLHLNIHLLLTDDDDLISIDPLHPHPISLTQWFEPKHLQHIFHLQNIHAPSSILQWALHHLAKEGHVKILAEPNLWVTDHRNLSLSSGTLIPIMSRNSRGSMTITYQPAEFKVDITPHAINSEIASVDLHLSYTHHHQISKPNAPPPLFHQSIHHQAIIHYHHPYVLGALNLKQMAQQSEEVPWAKHLPILKHLLHGKAKHHHQHQMLVIIDIEPEKINPKIA